MTASNGNLKHWEFALNRFVTAYLGNEKRSNGGRSTKGDFALKFCILESM